MTPDLVSVIMPVYNGERFIAQSIDSVLTQTYPHWELIVVNDGSTDGTASIVAEYNVPRVRCIHQENRGLAGARNSGILQAHGAYLAFLDADDLWAPQFLERCLQALDEGGDIVGAYTGNYFIDDAGALLPRSSIRVVKPEALHDQLLRGGFFPPCSVLIRTDIVMHFGMFDTDLAGQGTEDWDLWLRVTEGYRMQALPELLTFYRVYPGSMSTNASKMHACRLSVLAKRFGSPEGNPSTWPERKRFAYGYANRAAAFDFISQRLPDEGWQWLATAINIYPSLLSDLSTFYELACGDQPRGYRGQADILDLERNGTDMLRRLEHIFTSTNAFTQALRNVAHGHAYLALAMLSDQAGNWRAARQYIRKAVRSNPRFLRSAPIVRRLIKLHIGRDATGMISLFIRGRRVASNEDRYLP